MKGPFPRWLAAGLCYLHAYGAGVSCNELTEQRFRSVTQREPACGACMQLSLNAKDALSVD